MEIMDNKVFRNIKKNASYTPDEISAYISDIRLLLTDGDGCISDETAMKKIENYVFSLPKLKLL